MRTRIISAFAGCGKTYYHNKHKDTTLDSDSTNFSWIDNTIERDKRVRHPDWPNNYIKHIRDNIGKYDFIFVSAHQEVRTLLINNCIFFYLIYPEESNKEQFLQKYKDRGSSQQFIDLLSKNWKEWIRSCEFEKVGCEKVRMVLPNLEREISHIIASEGGDKIENV